MEVDLSRIKKILIIQYQPFGDILLNTAYFPYLKQKFPNAKIDFLIREKFKTVLEDNPNIDELVFFKNGKGLAYLIERINLLLNIRRRKYNLIIDQIRGTGSAQIVLFSKAEYKIGLKNKRLDFLYNIKVERRNVRYRCAMKFDLLKPLGIDEESFELFYHIKSESFYYINKWLDKSGLGNKKFICVSPGSPVIWKKWAIENFAACADMILENTDYEIVILWESKEKADQKKMVDLMKHKPYIAPPTNFNQAAALISKSKLLICNDGGLNHLSVAVKSPSLSIFGNTNPDIWGGAEIKGHYFLHNKNFNSKKDQSFGISPSRVYNKVCEILTTLYTE